MTTTEIAPMLLPVVSPLATPPSTTFGGTLHAQTGEETTIAVLQFHCAPADEYLADGAFEDIIETLSTTPGLRVKPAGVARAATHDPRAIGHGLGVDLVVAGSLRRTPAGLRVSARLIAVTDGFQIRAAAQVRITRLITDADPALVQLGSVEQARLAMWHRDDVAPDEGGSRLAHRMSGSSGVELRLYQAWRAGMPIDAAEWRAHASLVNSRLAFRMQAINLQRMVEIGVVMDRLDDAWFALRLANENTGLIDVVWVDHCPLFEPYRSNSDFVSIRDQIAQRARELLAAIHNTR